MHLFEIKLKKSLNFISLWKMKVKKVENTPKSPKETFMGFKLLTIALKLPFRGRGSIPNPKSQIPNRKSQIVNRKL